MIAEISVVPQVAGPAREIVARAVEEIEALGLPYEVGAVGTSVEGARGALRGLLGVKSAFERTPKRGAGDAPGGHGPSYSPAVTPATFLEGVLALYFLLGLGLALQGGAPWLVPFHALCFLSCVAVFAVSVAERW